MRLFAQPIKVRPFSIYHCTPAWSWTSGVFSDFDLWLVFSGRGTLYHQGREIDTYPGFCALFQPGDAVSASHDPENPLEVFACHFAPRNAPHPPPRLTRHLLYGKSHKIHEMRRNAETAIQAFHASGIAKEYATAIIVQLLWQTLVALQHPTTPIDDSRLGSLGLEVIAKPGSDWTVETMARQSGVSIPHFNRLFRVQYGMSPMRFVIRQRISRAIDLLRESTMSIQEIADSLGYRDVFFFHRQFRHIAGATPRSVRLGAKTLLDHDHSLDEP